MAAPGTDTDQVDQTVQPHVGTPAAEIGSQPSQEQPQVQLLTTKPASQKLHGSGGYECEFVQRRPPEALQTDCSICLHILREPHLISCCGHNFCKTCIDCVKKGGKNCPLCNASDFSLMRNKGLERQLNDYEVRCTYTKLGCQWTGKLRSLNPHLNVNPEPEKQLDGCTFVKVECSNNCDRYFQRRFLANHQDKECPKRPYSCDYCQDYKSTYDDVASNHFPECEHYPVSCPNHCTPNTIERQNVEHHVNEDCPLTEVSCDFHYAGCKVKLPRKDMPTHLTENLGIHMSYLAIYMHNRDLSKEVAHKEQQKIKEEAMHREDQLKCKKEEEIQRMQDKQATELEVRLRSERRITTFAATAIVLAAVLAIFFMSLLNLSLTRELHQKVHEKDEQIAELQLQLQQLDGKVREEFRQLDGKVEQLDGKERDRLQQLDGKVREQFQQLDGKVEQLDGKVREQLQQLDGKVEQLDGKVRDRLQQLDGKVEQLDGKVREQFQQLDGKVRGQIQQLDGHFHGLMGSAFTTEFTLTEFSQWKARRKGNYVSEPFYSDRLSYKFMFNIDFLDTGMHVYLYLLKGDYDDHQYWPIKCVTRIQIVNIERSASWEWEKRTEDVGIYYRLISGIGYSSLSSQTHLKGDSLHCKLHITVRPV